jgi:hypothetical protein
MMYTRSPALAVAAAAVLMLCPAASGAQERGRIVVTPTVDLLLPGSYYADQFSGDFDQGQVRIRQEALALIGGQLSYELPGTAWRVGLGYARGESDLKVYHYYRQGAPPTSGGPPTSSFQMESRYEEPATRELISVAASRALTRGPAAFEINTSLVHQRLDAVIYRGFLLQQRVEDNYSAWGMQLGGAVGPATGWARGLRVGARAQLLRTPPDLYNAFRGTAGPVPDAEFESALAASLGWRLTF